MQHLDLLGERARLSPEHVALVFVPTGERLSYAELDARAEACALFWQETLGLAKGDRVALLADNAIECVVAFFAAAKAGVVLVPMSNRATAHELGPILENCAPRCLLHGARFGGVVAALRRRSLESIETWLPLGGEGEGDRVTLITQIDAHRGRPRPTVPRALDDLWCLLYTSGTTGAPKGVMIPHRQVLSNGYNTALCWDLRPTDVSPIFTPLYHAGGLFAFLVPIVTAGGTLVLHGAFDTAEILRTIEAEGCTVVLGVPTIFQMLLEAPEFASTEFSRLRWWISGGAPLPASLLERIQAAGIVLKQGYGLTEVGVNCFTASPAEAAAKPGSIGRPMLLTEARLVDDNGAVISSADEVGELCLRGPHVCRGYWKNPDATAAALDAEGFFHTGDLARRDADGFFYIAGRRKEMFIRGGVNIYPAEIEAELVSHDRIHDAAVVGVPHPRWGEVGVAFVVATDPDLDAAILEAFLAERLAKYKIPRRIVFLDDLPRTAYGKVVKGELRDRVFAEENSLAEENGK